MKLKYYLRGLGIGMLVAALVLTLSGNTDARMSDEAVKRRAAELGMVEKDKTVLSDIGDGTAAAENTQIQPEISENAAASQAAGEENKAAETAGEENKAEAETEKEEPEEQVQAPEENAGTKAETPAEGKEGQTDAQQEKEEEQALAREIEQRADEVADRAHEVAENSVPEKTVTLEVRRGDSSVSVARRAAEAGLVQSAADFDVFLCQNGYDKRISIGSYEITVGASEKEIADTITKSN